MHYWKVFQDPQAPLMWDFTGLSQESQDTMYSRIHGLPSHDKMWFMLINPQALIWF